MVSTSRREPGPPRLLALVTAVLALAVIATLVYVSHGLHPNPVPAKSTAPPPPRAGAMVAFDHAHGVMVLFGGNGSPPLNDTWTWDGSYWTRQHPGTSPAPRHDGAMAYDAARHEVVLFGGMAQVGIAAKAGQAAVDDTWIWNGSAWVEKHPQHEPAFGFDWPATMEFDPITSTVLLYAFTNSYAAQTWSWNGSDWAQLTPLTTPGSIATMVSDGHEILLLAGSSGQVGGRYLTQTWAWDGSNWNVLSPKVDLPPVGFVSAAYDQRRGQLVVLTSDTWTWDGTTWSRQHPAMQPPTVGYVAYVSSLQEVVSWGDRSSALDNQMFAWDGTNWNLIEPGTVVAQNFGGKGYLGPMTSAEAEATVRAAVKNTHPVLVPSVLPGGPYDVLVLNADADSFSIRYMSDLRDRTIEFGIVVPNPPPATDSHASLTTVTFRGAAAQYQVYDTSSALSTRWLIWNQRGTMAVPQTKAPGVPYFLSTEGLTDQEFWQVANSLK